MCAASERPSFSHKRHAPLKLDCSVCHTTVKTAERAGFPPAGQCMICHRAVLQDSPDVKKLAALPKDQTIVPAARVYRVPDFVVFSHARHLKAAVGCDTCHGQVMAKDVIAKEVTLNMKFCVDCHKVKSATVDCNACHELNQ
jgi:hypothetical protein